jgi:hypothetical protein
MEIKAYEILRDSILSQPRMMGTDGETATSQFLSNSLAEMGIEPQSEQIPWSKSYIYGRKIMYTILWVCFLFVQISFYFSSPINHWLGLLSPFGIVGVMIGWGKIMQSAKFNLFWKQYPGQNIIGEIPAALLTDNSSPSSDSASQIKHIYLSAHSDSVAVNMPKIYVKLMIGMGIGGLLVLLLSFTAGILGLIYVNTMDVGVGKALQIIHVIRGVLVAVIGALIGIMLQSQRINQSPGAVDNGSGSAILLELASRFQTKPCQHVNLTFLWASAEEWGLFGSKAYLKAHITPWKEYFAHQSEEANTNDSRPNSSHLAKKYKKAFRPGIMNINVDMVGSEIAYLGSAGFLRKHPLNPHLNSLIEDCAQTAQIEVRKFNSMMGGSSDHASFQKEKIEVCCFLSKKDTKFIHSAKDTIDMVNPEKIAGAVDLITAMIRKLDTPLDEPRE